MLQFLPWHLYRFMSTPSLPIEKLQRIESLIRQSKNILLVSHKSPDGDTVGTATAWYEMLTMKGKNCSLVCYDPLPTSLQFLPHAEKYRQDFCLNDFDLIIASDSGAHHLLGFHETKEGFLTVNSEGKFEKSLPMINIDHHKTNERYGDVNLVHPEFASTTMLLLEIFQQFGWDITRNIATSLITGIYTDTGSMMHSNTNPLVYRMASYLLSRGANIRRIQKDIFHTIPISTLRLWGRVLSNMYKDSEGVTIAVVTDRDFIDTGADYSELSGVIDYLNSVPDSKFTVLLTERDGKVKGSLRTLEDIDVAEIAERFGGGGHKKAAGFTIPGKLQKEVRWKIIS